MAGGPAIWPAGKDLCDAPACPPTFEQSYYGRGQSDPPAIELAHSIKLFLGMSYNISKRGTIMRVLKASRAGALELIQNSFKPRPPRLSEPCV
ncbi:hypothetical protein AKJ60_00375 [candidate division MSBL1 archaeon SCGC-AAA385M11]|nr:hypothetical protein AKJ60_00375 [candidate division MSBL1 archaeon SCGC-AAA385M11]